MFYADFVGLAGQVVGEQGPVDQPAHPRLTFVMRCATCQTDNREQAKFCRSCGARLAPSCSACGARLEADSRFCDACGAAVATVSPSGDSRFASPGHYTPSHLARRILSSRSALEGERKQVTVMFADMKGSMELLAERDPEEAQQLLDGAVACMMEAVHRYDGTVNQVLGDGIMALFGAPLAVEDHALRACYAALAMMARMRRYAEEVRRSLGVSVQIRIGLNSGEVVVRAISTDLRMDYSAIGQTTHLAARIEQAAPAGTILLAPTTMRLVEGWVEARSLGPVPIKGMPETAEVFELLNASSSRTRLQVAALRGLTRFVGRHHELEIMSAALAHALGGQGQIVALIGDPGVGKSRLVWEFVHSERARGWLVLQAASVSYGRARPYGPVRDLLRALFGIDESDDATVVRDKVTARVLALNGVLQDTMPPVLALLEGLPEDSSFFDLDPRERRQHTLEAIRRLLLRQSMTQPLLVVLEDLHWVDSETRTLLDLLVEQLPRARMLLLVNYRTEYQHTWAGKTYYTQLGIEPLSAQGAHELLETLLGGGPELAELKQFLIQRTDGNPLFLEESIRTLVETHALDDERGAYRLTRPLRDVEVPPTVQAVLAARIDRLAPERKDLLQTASAIGKDVPLALLEAVVDAPDDEFRAGLAELQGAEFLYEFRLFPDVEYTFKHALTHQVAYGSLLQVRQRALHARIAQAIERLYAEALNEHVERLGYHAFRGELWDQAVRYLRQAGAQASSHYAHPEAVTHFEQALVALRHLPETPETLGLAVDLRFDLRNGLFPLGELEKISAYLREAEALAEKLGDRRRLGWVSAYMTHYFWRVGEHARAITSGQYALAIAAELGDLALQTTNVNLGLAYYAVGEYGRAMECLIKTVTALPSERLSERFGWAGLPSVTSRAYLVACLAELGEFTEGVRRGEEAIVIAEAANHAFSLGQACVNLALLFLRRGDLPRAAALLERARSLGGLSNVSALYANVSSTLGYVYALAGRLEEGLPLLEHGVRQGAATQITARHSLWLAWLGEAQLLDGRGEQAVALARQALTRSRAHNERGNNAYVLRLFGDIAARQGPVDGGTAEDHYNAAMKLAAELGMRPLIGQCHLRLGAYCRERGEYARSRVEIERAIDLFRSLDAPSWLARAEAEVTLLATQSASRPS